MKDGSRAIAVGVVATAIAVTLWAAYPWTKMQCYRWAAERGGELNTRIALELCVARFGSLK